MKVIVLVAALFLSGCMTGPSYLSRSVDDAWNNSYKEMPLGTAIISDVIPIYPLVLLLALIPDIAILNPIQFWGFDVWKGKGAAFKHDNPSGAPKPFFL